MKWKAIEITAHSAFWILSWWVLNQSFGIEVHEEYIQENNEMVRKLTTSHPLKIPVLFCLLGKAALVYSNAFWALPKFLETKNKWTFARDLLMLISIAFIIEFVLNFGYSQLISETPIRPFLTSFSFNTLLSLLFLGLSMTYGLGKNFFKDELLKQQLRQERLSNELNFLKSQINPHFLINTLNNLYALSERQGNSELSDGINSLSGLMRYMLYDCQAELVPLWKEIEFIHNIIEMQKLRHEENDDVVIGFDISGDVNKHQIAPLILIPFVENAFKHGIDIRKGSIIKIKLEVEKQYLNFEVFNLKSGQLISEYERPGIGLENVQRRLKLQYPGKHQLEIQNLDDKFQIMLKLDL